jgi:SAM-dependent methyltransferase
MTAVSKDFNPPVYHPLYILRKNIYRRMVKFAPMLSGKLMDFGCGSKPYKALFTNISAYIGVDYDGEGHKHDDEQIDVYYDGHTIPFADNTFDSILTNEVLEHVFNLENIIGELHRVLKPGGKILITTPFAWMEHEAPVDFGRYTSFGMKALMERNGFEIITMEKTTNYLQTQTQLRNTYWCNHFFPKLRPFATASCYVYSLINNTVGLALAKIFPDRRDWYLNLVTLAQKKQ